MHVHDIPATQAIVIANDSTQFRSIKYEVGMEERAARLDPAACYRQTDSYCMTDLTCNHINAPPHHPLLTTHG